MGRTSPGHPKNLESGKRYRGVNVFLLAFTAYAMGYESSYWLTFNQARERGGTVRKGEKSSMVVFWKQIEATDEETGRPVKIPALRYHSVFNLSQCHGITVDRVFIAENSPSFGAANRLQFYVSVSRGRQLVRVYTDDREALLEAVQVSSERLAALDIIPVQAPDHDTEICEAQHRAESSGEAPASLGRLKTWLGQMRSVPDGLPKKSLDDMQEHRGEMAFDR